MLLLLLQVLSIQLHCAPLFCTIGWDHRHHRLDPPFQGSMGASLSSMRFWKTPNWARRRAWGRDSIFRAVTWLVRAPSCSIGLPHHTRPDPPWATKKITGPPLHVGEHSGRYLSLNHLCRLCCAYEEPHANSARLENRYTIDVQFVIIFLLYCISRFLPSCCTQVPFQRVWADSPISLAFVFGTISWVVGRVLISSYAL